MAYDLKITGGDIIDGTGRPRYRGDVGISGGTVVADVHPDRIVLLPEIVRQPGIGHEVEPH